MQALGMMFLVLAAVFLWCSKVRFWRARRRGGVIQLGRARIARQDARDARMIRRGHDVLFLVASAACYAAAGLIELWLIKTTQQLITGYIRELVPPAWYAPIIILYHAQALLLGGWRTLLFVLSGCLLGHLFW